MVWANCLGNYVIWVTQKYSRAEVSAQDVQIKLQDPDEKDCFIATSESQIAEGFNKFINDKFR